MLQLLTSSGTGPVVEGVVKDNPTTVPGELNIKVVPSRLGLSISPKPVGSSLSSGPSQIWHHGDLSSYSLTETNPVESNSLPPPMDRASN